MSEDIKVTDGTVLETLNNKVDIDFQNVPSNSVGFARCSTEVTNCITEIPQRIKAKFSDETFTLETGSVAIIPNEFESDRTTPKFDYVTINSDVTKAGYGSGSSDFNLTYVKSSNSLLPLAENVYFSGVTAPSGSQYMLWYDTKNNLIKYTNDGGVTWGAHGYSFTIASCTRVDGVITSIKEVFNGFGIFGSSFWLDKDIKALISNYKNIDGTLKNIEVMTNKIDVKTVDSTANASNQTLMIGSDGKIKGPTIHPVIYDEVNNTVSYQGAVYPWAVIGKVDITNGVMSNLRIKNTFRAADYQEVVKKDGDTFNGELIGISSPTPFIAQSSVMDITTTPTTNQHIGYDFRDKNGARIGWVGVVNHTNGNKYFNIQNINGVKGFEFPRCTTKATTTSSASNLNVAVVVQNYKNGTSWYRVWSDGWIEQGGNSAASAATVKVTFLKSFSDTNYTLIGTRSGSNGNLNIGHSAATRLTNSFEYHLNESVGGAIYWYACGY